VSYVFLGNGPVAAEILKWLVASGDRPAGLVVHPEARGRGREELIRASALPADRIWEGDAINGEQGVAWLKRLAPAWLISVYFGYLLKKGALAIPTKGGVNLHPALLPYNKGAYPNVWSIVDRTPAGVTLHYLDDSIDGGDIVAQEQVPVQATDTGATLYARLEKASIDLFKKHWPRLKDGTAARTPQKGAGTVHRVADAAAIDRIDPNRAYKAGELIDILRARTFPPHKGAYLDLGDRRIYVSVELTEESSS
jgi:methionyl-tRNA formyltransferase